jgi:hypothetical protein
MENVILELVKEIKSRNSEIGSYDSVIINRDLNHLLRFSNGVLEVPKYFYEEFKNSRNEIKEGQFDSLANSFEKYE